MIHLSDIAPVPTEWREATRADRLARLAAAMQRPDLAANELMRASALLARAARQMTTEQRERAIDALNEIRDHAGNIDSPGPIGRQKEPPR